MSIRVMTRIWEHSKAQGSALVVLLAIADFANDEGEAYPSVETLAKKARTGERNCHYILNELQKNGELVVEKNAGPHQCNLYRVQSLQGATEHEKEVQSIAPKPSIEPSGDAPSGPSSDSEESSSVPTGDIYTPKGEIQEWYAILQKTQPFNEDWLEAEACRVKHDITPELALQKAYEVQAWWPTARPKTQKEGNPFFHWRNWCIREPKHESPVYPSVRIGTNKKNMKVANPEVYIEEYKRRRGHLPWEEPRATGSGGKDEG